MTTTPTSDPLSALAAELGRIGRRLDGMGVELLALRGAEASGAGAAPSSLDQRATPPGGLSAPPLSGYGVAPAAAAPPWSPAPALPGGAVTNPIAGLDVAAAASGPQVRQVGVGRNAPAVAVGTPGLPHAPYGGYPGQMPPAGLGPRPGWGVQGGGWVSPALPPVGPPPAGRGPYPAPAPAPKRSPFTGARLLAWTGGAVTLLGVVLLLALAASRGWFTPPARIAFGAVLGGGLVGLGMWLHRRETGRAGALAVTATGFATLYLVDAAATAIYDYLPAAGALLVALVVAAAGLGLADRWRTELLAGGVVVGAAVLAPALADGWLLAALALALQLAALPVVLRRGWAVLMLLAAAGPMLYGVFAVLTEDTGAPNVLVVAGVPAAVLVVALATAVLGLRRVPTGSAGGAAGGSGPAGGAAAVRGSEPAGAPGPAGGALVGSVPAGAPGPADGALAGLGPAGAPGLVGGAGAAAERGAGARTWVGSIAAVVAAAVLPALAGAGVLDGWRGALVAGGAAVLLGALALLPATARPVKVAAGVAATTALLTATVVGLHGSAAAIAVLAEALVAALVAVGMRSRFAMVTALVLGVLGGLAALVRYAPLTTLFSLPHAPVIADLVTAVAVSVLVLAVAAALLVAGGRLGWIRPDAERAAIWVPIGLAGLYGAASTVVNAALLVSPTQSGFTAGHAVVTVSWTVGALVLLARGLRRPALRITGLVLVAAAVAKLVLFDLVALDGLARVGAFLGAGLVLLAAGTRYAKLVAEAEGMPPSE